MYKGTPAQDGQCMQSVRTGTAWERRCSGYVAYEIGTLRLCSGHAERMIQALEQQIKTDSGMRWWLHSALGVGVKPPASAANLGSELRKGLADVASRVPASNSVVYFMQREGMIKIGVSKDVSKRLREVSRGSAMPPGMTVGPVELLGTIPGSYEEEKALHRRFWRERVKGEWFRQSDALMAHIAELLA